MGSHNQYRSTHNWWHLAWSYHRPVSKPEFCKSRFGGLATADWFLSMTRTFAMLQDNIVTLSRRMGIRRTLEQISAMQSCKFSTPFPSQTCLCQLCLSSLFSSYRPSLNPQHNSLPCHYKGREPHHYSEHKHSFQSPRLQCNHHIGIATHEDQTSTHQTERHYQLAWRSAGQETCRGGEIHHYIGDSTSKSSANK